MTLQASTETPAEPRLDEHSLQANARPSSACNYVFIGLGMLLLAAAGLKTYEAYSQPSQTLYAIGTMAVICFEICLGVWLLIGLRLATTLWTAIACFACFACVSGYKLATGASSCGCFGTLEVHPAITLVIDLTAVFSLLWCRTGVVDASESKFRKALPRFAITAVVLCLSATSLAVYGQTRFVQSGITETKSGDLIVLEPDAWVGERWSLLAESSIPKELAVGTWEVLLFRHDCHVCHDVMVEIEEQVSAVSETRRIALIGIDAPRPDDIIDDLQARGCVVAHLPQDREWFATTPVRVQLRDGVCLSAATVKSWE